jgi:TonB-like protein
MRFGSFITCLVAAPMLIAAGKPVRLEPSSQWILDYAENSCRLVRSFGEGNSKIFLQLESDSPDDLDMVLIGKPLASEQEEISANFLPHPEAAAKGRPVTSKGEPAILFSTVRLLPANEAAKVEATLAERKAHPDVRPAANNLADEVVRRTKRQEFADTANELQVNSRPGRTVILETGPLGKPIQAFDKCNRDSLRDWGVDPNLEDKIVRPVWLVNRQNLIRSEDYPTKMLDEGQQSDVNVRVLVDASGRVTKCTSLSHFNLPQFNQLVCDKITTAAKFEPAELADGTKVPSYYTVRINFRIGQ